MAGVGALRLNTIKVDCAASTAATRLTATFPGRAYKAVTVTADVTNSGSIWIASTSALAVAEDGIPLAPGSSYDLGPVPGGGHQWTEIDMTTVWVRSNSGTGDDAIFTFYTVE